MQFLYYEKNIKMERSFTGSYTEEIIEKLIPYIGEISRATYFRKRDEAARELGNLLWGYTTKECNSIIEHYFVDKEIGGENG